IAYPCDVAAVPGGSFFLAVNSALSKSFALPTPGIGSFCAMKSVVIISSPFSLAALSRPSLRASACTLSAKFCAWPETCCCLSNGSICDFTSGAHPRGHVLGVARAPLRGRVRGALRVRPAVGGVLRPSGGPFGSRRCARSDQRPAHLPGSRGRVRAEQAAQAQALAHRERDGQD